MSNNNDSYSKIAEKMRSYEHVLIFPHIHPDGDALGSSGALCRALRILDIEAYVLVDENFPHNFDFLDEDISTFDNEVFNGLDYLAVMVDCSDTSRISNRLDVFKSAKERIVIDHHITASPDFTPDLMRVEPDSAATGELIYYIINELGITMDKYISYAIFTAITTDTGNFQHSNTTARSHKIAAALYDVDGFNSKPVSNLIYNRDSLNSFELEKLVMDSIKIYEQGKIIIAFITQEMLKKTNTDMSETDRFITKLMTIDEVEIAVILKENQANLTKVSLRAKSYADVSKLADKFGGGGHKRAAGFNLSVPPKEALSLIIDDLKKALQNEWDY